MKSWEGKASVAISLCVCSLTQVNVENWRNAFVLFFV